MDLKRSAYERVCFP